MLQCHHEQVWCLVTAPGTGWNFPRRWPRTPHPLLLVLGQPIQALIWPTDDFSRVYKQWAGHRFVSKSLLEHSHTHLFLSCLWLLSSRVEYLQQRPHGPQSLKYLLSVLLQKNLPSPALMLSCLFSASVLPKFFTWQVLGH